MDPTANPPAPTAAPVTVDSLVAPLASAMPPVTPGQESAPAPAHQPAPTTPAPVLRDSHGVRFNPDRHQVNADGSPRKNSKGNFMHRPEYRAAHGGRASGKSQAPAAPAPGGDHTPAPARPAPSFADPSAPPSPAPVGSGVPDVYELQAEVYLQSSYGPLMLALTPAVRPDDEQHKALKQSLAALLRHKQAEELDPAWAFYLTAAGVLASKYNEPTVRERLALIWLKARGFFKRKE